MLIWHNTKDGQNGVNPPTPIPRPGTTAEPPPPERTLEELDAILGRKKKGGDRGG